MCCCDSRRGSGSSLLSSVFLEAYASSNKCSGDPGAEEEEWNKSKKGCNRCRVTHRLQ